METCGKHIGGVSRKLSLQVVGVSLHTELENASSQSENTNNGGDGNGGDGGSDVVVVGAPSFIKVEIVFN